MRTKEARVALREQRSRQDALIAGCFETVAAARAAAAKVERIRTAGAERVARLQAEAAAKVAKAQQETAPTAAAVAGALVAVADVIGEPQTIALLGVTAVEIRSARRSRKAHLSTMTETQTAAGNPADTDRGDQDRLPHWRVTEQRTR